MIDDYTPIARQVCSRHAGSPALSRRANHRPPPGSRGPNLESGGPGSRGRCRLSASRRIRASVIPAVRPFLTSRWENGDRERSRRRASSSRAALRCGDDSHWCRRPRRDRPGAELRPPRRSSPCSAESRADREAALEIQPEDRDLYVGHEPTVRRPGNDAGRRPELSPPAAVPGPGTPYDMFSGAPLVTGRGHQLKISCSSRSTRSRPTIDVTTTIGYGSASGTGNVVNYWGDAIMPSINPNLGSRAFTLTPAFPTHNGQDPVSATEARLSLRFDRRSQRQRRA